MRRSRKTQESKCNSGVAVVDDERELVNIYQQMLTMNGIPICFVAYDGEEAVKKFQEHNPRPHIVLMDYRLPTINGVQAMKQMLSVDQETRFIFLSADDSVEQEALKYGAVMFMHKPCSIKDIIGAVKRVAECRK